MAKKPTIQTHDLEMVDPSDLTPHPRNYRTHPDSQIEHLKQSITEHGFYRNVVIAKDGTLLAGHGVVEAAKQMNVPSIPVMRMNLKPNDPQALQILAADNVLGLFAEDDEEMLSELLAELNDLDYLFGTGFDENTLNDLFPEADDMSIYTNKVVAPIYEPTEPAAPPITELIDRTKTEELQVALTKTELPEELRAFLHAAAERHTVLRFDRIAEYYAHAPAEVQRLFEDSALVIVDFDQAIEQGFVKMNKDITTLFSEEHPDA